MRSHRSHRWWLPCLLSSLVSCGGAPAAAPPVSPSPPASLRCQDNDGRCVVCAWMERGAQRCRVTIFSGGCPMGAKVDRGACPAGPSASCDRSTPGYLAGRQGYGDVDFYYGAQELAQAEADCARASPSFTGASVVWTVYR